MQHFVNPITNETNSPLLTHGEEVREQASLLAMLPDNGQNKLFLIPEGMLHFPRKGRREGKEIRENQEASKRNNMNHRC